MEFGLFFLTWGYLEIGHLLPLMFFGVWPSSALGVLCRLFLYLLGHGVTPEGVISTLVSRTYRVIVSWSRGQGSSSHHPRLHHSLAPPLHITTLVCTTPNCRYRVRQDSIPILEESSQKSEPGHPKQVTLAHCWEHRLQSHTREHRHW